MFVKIITFIVLISPITCDPRRVPKIYNAVITSSDNLEPSKAYPIIQPVIQPAAIAYQVHLPYIPNGAYSNYLLQHFHPGLNTFTGQYNQNFGLSNPANLLQIPQGTGSLLGLQNVAPLSTLNTGTEMQSETSNNGQNLRQPQYQQLAQQPNVIEAQATLQARSNVAPVQINPNHQIPQQNEQNVAPSVTNENTNQPSNGNAIAGMPQYGDILNNQFKHKYSDIPDVPPPPFPTSKRKMQEGESSNVQPPFF